MGLYACLDHWHSLADLFYWPVMNCDGLLLCWMWFDLNVKLSIFVLCMMSFTVIYVLLRYIDQLKLDFVVLSWNVLLMYFVVNSRCCSKGRVVVLCV